MTWNELAEVHRRASRHLFEHADGGHWRATCGRSYFAAYALVTAHVSLHVVFRRGWQNPEHAQLPRYDNNIPKLNERDKKTVKAAIRRLRQRREDSDYRPGILVGRNEAHESIRDAAEVFRILEQRV